MFASASDDGNVNLYHGMVYNDLMKNALIVPLRKLKAHERGDNLGCIAIDFHPEQPWLMSAGADGKIHLFT
jgi:ribosome biogenesis protein ERB1